jgi:hypothetical protein
MTFAKKNRQVTYTYMRDRGFLFDKHNYILGILNKYRGADKSLAQPGRKQATATEDFDVHISYLQS